MKITHYVIGAVALATVAFAIGRSGLVASGTTAVAAPPQDTGMSPEMQKMMQLGQPGPHHKHLDVLVGKWEGNVRMWMEPGAPPMEAPVKVTREWVLGGRYLKEHVTSVSDWGEFHGLGFVGFNNSDGQYESVWMDSDTTGMVKETASYDPSSKTMISRGSRRDPISGRISATWGKIDMSNPNRQTMTGYMTGADGKEFKTFEGVFERIK